MNINKDEDKCEDEYMEELERTSKSLETSFDIHGVYTSRRSDEFTSLALVGDYCLKLFSIYDLEGQGCEIEFRWELDYRLDPILKPMGKCSSFDFDDSGMTFSIGTQVGWVCSFSFETKGILKYFHVQNPEDPTQTESIDMLRDVNLPSDCVVYCSKTRHLLYVSQYKNYKHN